MASSSRLQLEYRPEGQKLPSEMEGLQGQVGTAAIQDRPEDGRQHSQLVVNFLQKARVDQLDRYIGARKHGRLRCLDLSETWHKAIVLAPDPGTIEGRGRNQR